MKKLALKFFFLEGTKTIRLNRRQTALVGFTLSFYEIQDAADFYCKDLLKNVTVTKTWSAEILVKFSNVAAVLKFEN